MKADRALELIRSLADGRDPHSGEELPIAGPYQQPEVIRALFMAARALEREAWREKRRQGLPPNTGNPWRPDEEHQLLARFSEGASLELLASLHRRTVKGIEERLVRLGKLNKSH